MQTSGRDTRKQTMTLRDRWEWFKWVVYELRYGKPREDLIERPGDDDQWEEWIEEGKANDER